MQVYATALQVEEQMKTSLLKHRSTLNAFACKNLMNLKKKIQNYVYLKICLKL